MRIEDRYQLKQLRADCQAAVMTEPCRVLICGGTGCLAGGAGKIYERMCALAEGNGKV